MHLLLIIIILMLAFPMFARFVGGVLSMVFWLILVIAVLAVFGALSYRDPLLTFSDHPERSRRFIDDG